MSKAVLYKEITADNLPKDMGTHCIVNRYTKELLSFLVHGNKITMVSEVDYSLTIPLRDIHNNYMYAEIEVTTAVNTDKFITTPLTTYLKESGINVTELTEETKNKLIKFEEKISHKTIELYHNDDMYDRLSNVAIMISLKGIIKIAYYLECTDIIMDLDEIKVKHKPTDAFKSYIIKTKVSERVKEYYADTANKINGEKV